MGRKSSTTNWSRRARKRFRREGRGIYKPHGADEIKIALIKDEFLNHIIFGQKHLKDRKKTADILFFGLMNDKYGFNETDVKDALEQLLNLRYHFKREINESSWYNDWTLEFKQERKAKMKALKVEFGKLKIED